MATRMVKEFNTTCNILRDAGLSDILKEIDTELQELRVSVDSAVTLANDIKTQYEAHRADATSHSVADSTNVVTAADATAKDTIAVDLGTGE